MSCGVGHRQDSDPALLWLWCGLAAVAPIQLLAWEPLYAMGAVLKKKKKEKEKENAGFFFLTLPNNTFFFFKQKLC